VNIRIRFYGVFRTAAKMNELDLDVEGSATVKSVITQLVSQERFEDLMHLLLDNGASDPRPNALIMVSGREINTLIGLETELTEND
jgi:molybdopterin converting factor small subunit